MGKHLSATGHIAKLNEVTKSQVNEITSSMVDEIDLAILKRHGSWGITIVSSQRQIIFDIQVNPYWLKWQSEYFKLAAKDFETSEFLQDRWNLYLMFWFVSAYIAWNALSNLGLRWSYTALRDNLVPLSSTTLTNICQREYTLTVDPIEKQLPSRNTVSFALDRWTATNKLVIMWVIAYYMDRNWALCEIQLAFDEVDCLCKGIRPGMAS